jgi:hypothetical protein
LYFSAFMSFSLLPVVAIAFAFPVVLGLLAHQPRKAGQMAAIVAAMFCGGALAWIVGKALFGYDPVARYNASTRFSTASNSSWPAAPHSYSSSSFPPDLPFSAS